MLKLKLATSESVLICCLYHSPNSGAESNAKFLELMNKIPYSQY
jgi:hypothetical protein